MADSCGISPPRPGNPPAAVHIAWGILRPMDGDTGPIRVLHLEDSELDHELAMAHLRRGGLTVETRRVETRQEFEEALGGRWDVILSDFNLPELVAPAFGIPSSLAAELIYPFSRHIALDQDTDQWAIFGNVDFELTDRLTASVGFAAMEYAALAESRLVVVFEPG